MLKQKDILKTQKKINCNLFPRKKNNKFQKRRKNIVMVAVISKNKKINNRTNEQTFRDQVQETNQTIRQTSRSIIKQARLTAVSLGRPTHTQN